MNRREISVLGGNAIGKIKKEKALKDYYNNPVFCKQCLKLIEPVVTKKGGVNIYVTRKKKFCDHSCSATYNNPHVIKKIAHICENPNCDRLTKNKKFCSKKCEGNNKKLLKIERFLNGELNDDCVRDETIRSFLIERQDGVCLTCGIEPVWNSKPIVFIVDHIDGNYENNSPDNIRAICPNCNSQSETFSGRNNNKIEHLIKRAKSNPNRK